MSPSKFKNFEPQLTEAGNQYKYIFEAPEPRSQDPAIQSRKDGARKLLNLITTKFLPFKDLDLWRDQPETFIEMETESIFINELDYNSEQSLRFLSY